MMSIKISDQIIYRKAELSDALRLSVLCSQVFIDTYGADGVSTESAIFINKEFSIKKTEENIKKNPDNILVAAYKDNLIGFAELEFNIKIPGKELIAAELTKLYVLEIFCGKGIGYNLLKRIESIVHSKGEKEIWLSVLSTNERAVKFYEKQGFEWIGNFDFRMEFNSYDNKIMYKRFNIKKH